MNHHPICSQKPPVCFSSLKTLKSSTSLPQHAQLWHHMWLVTCHFDSTTHQVSVAKSKGLTHQTRRLQNEPKNNPIRQKMTEIWSKYCFDHISVIFCLIGLFLGSFWSSRVWQVDPYSSLGKCRCFFHHSCAHTSCGQGPPQVYKQHELAAKKAAKAAW